MHERSCKGGDGCEGNKAAAHLLELKDCRSGLIIPTELL
jgi:hypothetical protein